MMKSLLDSSKLRSTVVLLAVTLSLNIENANANYKLHLPNPNVNLRILPTPDSNISNLASFQLEMIPNLPGGSPSTEFTPAELRVKLQVKTSNNSVVIDTNFPEILTLPNPGGTHIRTWRVPASIATKLANGTYQFEFHVNDLANNLVRMESIPMVVTTRPQGTKAANPILPRVDLNVEFSTDTLGQTLGAVSQRLISVNSPSQVVVKTSLGFTTDLSYSNPPPQTISLNLARPNLSYLNRITLPIPQGVDVYFPQDGNQIYLITEVLDGSNQIRRKEVIPLRVESTKPDPSPDPAFVYQNSPILKAEDGTDLPVSVTPTYLPKEAKAFANDMQSWADMKTRVYVFNLLANKPFSLASTPASLYGPPSANAVESRRRLMSWISNYFLQNYGQELISGGTLPPRVDDDLQSSAIASLYGDRWDPHFRNSVGRFSDLIVSLEKDHKRNVVVDRPIASSWVNKYPQNYNPFVAGRVLYFITQEPVVQKAPEYGAKLIIIDNIYDE